MGHRVRSTSLRLLRRLRTQFFAGILVIVPVGITMLILVWIFNSVDNILQPLVRGSLGHPIPGVGFAAVIILIYLAGVIATWIGGAEMHAFITAILRRVPVIRTLYSGIRQILEGLSRTGKTGFRQVVLIEFPCKGMKAIGFVTNVSVDQSGKRLFNVLVPNAPNPASGFLEIVEETEIIQTNLSVEDAIKMIVSAGLAMPPPVTENTKGQS
ncbi:MAG: DUF502 domain-containing protein [Chloroflexi bacterium]|nr:DUF502 domain-containing protein [Chloroflexota bacterium]